MKKKLWGVSGALTALMLALAVLAGCDNGTTPSAKSGSGDDTEGTGTGGTGGAGDGGNDNAMTWTEAAHPFSNSNSFARLVAWGNNTFVAVGNVDDGNGSAPLCIATSPDGVTWTVVPAANIPFTGTIDALVYCNNTFIAAGDSGNYDEIATSLDGITWTPCTSIISFTSSTIHLAGGNGTFVAGGGSKVSTSTDGLTWTPPHDFGSSTTIKALTWGNNTFVAMLGMGGTYISTDNGQTWTYHYANISDCQAIAWGNNKFVITGLFGNIATSPDGVTWTAHHIGYSTITPDAVVWGSNKFVAGGGSGNLVTSPDGVTWTMGSPPFIIVDIAYGNGTFVAVGRDSNYNGKIAYSN